MKKLLLLCVLTFLTLSCSNDDDDSTDFGYELKSSLGENCVGFIKMLTTVCLHICFDFFIRERCPAWIAPMVGTNPIVPERKFRNFLNSERDDMVLMNQSELNR